MQSKQYFTKIKNYPHEKSTEPLHPKDKDVLKKEKANKLVINLLAF